MTSRQLMNTTIRIQSNCVKPANILPHIDEIIALILIDYRSLCSRPAISRKNDLKHVHLKRNGYDPKEKINFTLRWISCCVPAKSPIAAGCGATRGPPPSSRECRALKLRRPAPSPPRAPRSDSSNGSSVRLRQRGARPRARSFRATFRRLAPAPVAGRERYRSGPRQQGRRAMEVPGLKPMPRAALRNAWGTGILFAFCT